MGYTHYWTPKPIDETAWATLMEQTRRIIAAAEHKPDKIELRGPMGDEGTRPEIDRIMISLNGRAPYDHETFLIEPTDDSWTFCKTARKPYDTVVTAMLTLLAADYGYAVTSDGGVDDWEAGVRLVERALGRPFANPLVLSQLLSEKP